MTGEPAAPRAPRGFADSRLVPLPRIDDPRGSLTFVESRRNVAFDIARATWSYTSPGVRRPPDVPVRGTSQFLLALVGRFEVLLRGEGDDRIVDLQRPDVGLHVPPGVWRAPQHHAPDALCLVLESSAEEQPRVVAPAAVALPASHARATLADCALVPLRRVEREGVCTVSVDGGRDVPFAIERVYYLYGVPGDAVRGGHAHLELRQLIVAAAGSFEVVLDDGASRTTVLLDRPDVGLLLPQMIWRELGAFSPGGVCVVLASAHYDESDYIRDYDEFVRERRRPAGA